ncbi:MAG: hypothetical protein GDA41_12065 [Rhodospirillales bacterium]|nr:hypothetical protein [Rhodospirillales bacterium]
MSRDAISCTLRVAMEDPAVAEVRNKLYAEALKANRTAFSLMKASNYVQVAVEDVLRGHTRGFLVMPCGWARPEEILTYLSASWVEALRDGRAGLILDQSKEGIAYRKSRVETWHRQLKALGISPSRVICLTQNRNFQVGYNRWCKQKGVETRIAIINYDYHLSKFCRRSWPDPAAALAEKIQDFENRTEIEKRFVCLNYKPRAWRIALLTRLIKDNYWDDGFISFGGFDVTTKNVSFSGEIERFRALNLAAGSEAYLEALAGKGRVLFGQALPGSGKAEKRQVRRTGDTSTYLYRRSAFTLVTETNMRPTADRITEKSLKPIANCRSR